MKLLFFFWDSYTLVIPWLFLLVLLFFAWASWAVGDGDFSEISEHYQHKNKGI